jgi:hypothetical protein
MKRLERMIDRNMREVLPGGGELIVRYNTSFPRMEWEAKFINGGYLFSIGRLRVFVEEPGEGEALWARHLETTRRDRRAGDVKVTVTG